MSGQNPPAEPLKPPAPDQTTGTGPAPQDSGGDIGAVPTSGARGSGHAAAERVREDAPANGQHRRGDRGSGGIRRLRHADRPRGRGRPDRKSVV